MLHDGAQIAGLLIDAKLPLGAGAFIENGVNVFDGAAAAELVDGIVVGSRAVEAAEAGPAELARFVSSLRAALDAVAVA